jgi:hypothetical protein
LAYIFPADLPKQRHSRAIAANHVVPSVRLKVFGFVAKVGRYFGVVAEILALYLSGAFGQNPMVEIFLILNWLEYCLILCLKIKN